MGIKRAPAPESKEFDKLEEGEYDGRLVYVADLGMQEGQEYNKEQKPDCQQLALGIEIVDNPVEVDGELKPRVMWVRPFNIFSNFTAKGKELAYYKVFSPKTDVKDDPDWDAQLGKPCTVVVDHVTSKDKVYDNVADILTIPAKYQEDVTAAATTPVTGDPADTSNGLGDALYGLVKYVFEKRLNKDGSDGGIDDIDTDADVAY